MGHRRRGGWAAVLAAVLAVSAVGHAQRRVGKGDGRPIALEAMLQTGRLRVVVQQASAQLERSPDNPELHALLGVAWSRLGYHADALGAFQLATGAAVYEERGLEAHATALRGAAGGAAAADLRLQRLLQPLDTNTEHRVLMNAADDLRETGDLDGALALAEQGAGAFPDSGVMAALLADIYLDMGDLDAAHAELWRAEARSRGGAGVRGSAAWVRLHLRDGDPIAATAMAKQGARGLSANARAVALYAESLRQLGEPEEARALLEKVRWRLTEEPDILAARLRVLTDLGELSEARELSARLDQIAGQLVVVQRSRAYLQDHPAGSYIP